MVARYCSWGFGMGLGWSLLQTSLLAGSFTFDSLTLTVPDGLVVEKVAGPPLVDRPIMADFDPLGRLYVADSSGSNAKVETQLEEKPHRIVRLEDTDGDGVFDRRVVFAERMMFPEGVLWHRGSLLVSAPPVIWKLTDTDDDGVCDLREVWHDGQTLTGCANDLHGPYLGWDGWIYWCKGAFAEQRYPQADGSTFVSRAAHVFRKPFAGGFLEPVMTGGMDNPVELVFSMEGERFFSTTFLQHPGGGRRDGLIHAIYGGVYGKNHGVLEGHPRTGGLMPVMTHHGPAASCALMRYESAVLGTAYEGNLFATLFNMRKVTRHRLIPEGATFRTEDEDFLVGDHIDFHPTDVLEAPDGSVLVVDTGGWYKLCCPTSQLAKPAVFGAIYRVRPRSAAPLRDPCGIELGWDGVEVPVLAERLSDARPMVWKRAMEGLAQGEFKISPEVWDRLGSLKARQRFLWAMTRRQTSEARAWIRRALGASETALRHTALHAVSVQRDREAVDAVARLLDDEDAAVRRAAAEALGRLGDRRHVNLLLRKLESPAMERVEAHSLRYALIEIGDEEALVEALEAGPSHITQVALATLHELRSSRLTAERVLPLLQQDSSSLRAKAWEVVAQHPEWAEGVAGQLPVASALDPAAVEALRHLAEHPAIQRYLAAQLGVAGQEAVILTLLEGGRIASLDPALWGGLERLLRNPGDHRARAVRVIRRIAPLPENVAAILGALAHQSEVPPEVRLDALGALAGRGSVALAPLLPFLRVQLGPAQPLARRQQALAVVSQSSLGWSHWGRLEEAFQEAGPMVLERLLNELARDLEKEVPSDAMENLRRVVAALARNVSLASLPPGTVNAFLHALPQRMEASRESLRNAMPSAFTTVDEQKRRLETRLAALPDGDVVRGQAVFNSAEAACVSCHEVGYLGGTLGPDLTRVGQIRSRRDLLEAILFPSASMVRSYETAMVTTREGRLWLGIPVNEGAETLTLRLGPESEVTLQRDEIAEWRPSAISLMPSGLDRLLTDQQLADLLAFLENAR